MGALFPQAVFQFSILPHPLDAIYCRCGCHTPTASLRGDSVAECGSCPHAMLQRNSPACYYVQYLLSGHGYHWFSVNEQANLKPGEPA
jgi:hypothetical protein